MTEVRSEVEQALPEDTGTVSPRLLISSLLSRPPSHYLYLFSSDPESGRDHKTWQEAQGAWGRAGSASPQLRDCPHSP